MIALTTPRGKSVPVDEHKLDWLRVGIERGMDPGSHSMGHEALKVLCFYIGGDSDEAWALLRYAKEKLLEEYIGTHDLKRYRLLH